MTALRGIPGGIDLRPVAPMTTLKRTGLTNEFEASSPYFGDSVMRERMVHVVSVRGNVMNWR